jgi:hypothetical protein
MALLGISESEGGESADTSMRRTHHKPSAQYEVLAMVSTVTREQLGSTAQTNLRLRIVESAA